MLKTKLLLSRAFSHNSLLGGSLELNELFIHQLIKSIALILSKIGYIELLRIIICRLRSTL
jgi:hypothetical protein